MFWKVLGLTLLALVGLWFALRELFIYLALPWLDALLPVTPDWAGWLTFIGHDFRQSGARFGSGAASSAPSPR